jgi:hypothetical protein
MLRLANLTAFRSVHAGEDADDPTVCGLAAYLETSDVCQSCIQVVSYMNGFDPTVQGSELTPEIFADIE